MQLNSPTNDNGSSASLGDVHLLVAARRAEQGADELPAGLGEVSQNWVLQIQVCHEREVGRSGRNMGRSLEGLTDEGLKPSVMVCTWGER